MKNNLKEIVFSNSKKVDQDSLSFHLELESFNSAKIITFKCEKCQKVFASQNSLNRHIKTVHNKVKVIKPTLTVEELTCKCCSMAKVFRTLNGLQLHENNVRKGKNPKVENNSKERKCSTNEKTNGDSSPKSFSTDNELGKLNSSKKNSFKCEKCLKVFAFQSSLKRHIKTVHNTIKMIKPTPTIEELTCKCCSMAKVFRTTNGLLCHEYNIRKGKNPKVENISEDGKVSSNEKTNGDSCPKSYSTDNNELEKDNSSKKISFKCSKCPMVLSAQCSLKKQIQRFHNNITSGKCPHCNGLYKEVNVHIRYVHDNLRKSQCNICKKMFKNNFKMVSHVKQVHERVKNHECSLCQKKFPQKQNLQMHVRAIHEKIKPYQCDLCGNSFAQNSSYSLHKKRMHTIEN